MSSDTPHSNDERRQADATLSTRQARAARAYASDLRRLGDKSWHPVTINDILSKAKWRQLHKQNLIYPVDPDSDHTQYRVDERVRERVKSYGNDPALPCGCVGFTNLGDGYECNCGRNYRRVEIKQHLFSDGRGQLTPLGTAALVVVVGLLLLAAIALAHGVML
jgi:hypothetical protein